MPRMLRLSCALALVLVTAVHGQTPVDYQDFNFTETAALALHSAPQDIVSGGGLAYAALGDSGIAVVDVSDLAAPVLLQSRRVLAQPGGSCCRMDGCGPQPAPAGWSSST